VSASAERVAVIRATLVSGGKIHVEDRDDAEALREYQKERSLRAARMKRERRGTAGSGLDINHPPRRNPGRRAMARSCAGRDISEKVFAKREAAKALTRKPPTAR
jgi:hypothetical protein